MMTRRVLAIAIGTVVLVGGLTGAAVARRELISPSVTVGPLKSSSRHDHSQHQSGVSGDQSHKLTLAVDGKQTPELVSDEIAYRHFLAASSLSDSLSEKSKRGVRARIARIGLSAADAQYFESTLRDLRVRDELTRIKKARAALNPATAQRPQTVVANLQLLRFEEEDLMRFAKGRVLQGLTPDGVSKLDSFVQQRVKRQIKILRGGDMSAAH